MSYRLQYGTVRQSQRRAIYVLRVRDAVLEPPEVTDLIERLRERLHARGEVPADIVLVQGDSKRTLRLFGTPYYVTRVRASMFNAEIAWMPLSLD